MHWGHAISTDMVHWEEYPIALYPDRFGTMFSGSAVVDVNNTSGFFTELPEKKGLVAIYTNDGSGGQQQAIAYSLDKGRTWIKYNDGEPVIKRADDPLNHGDFRDPKVFWHDESNQWMMVIAGGPLRFYSSHNLIDWTFESGYKDSQTIDGKYVNDIHTECPDFFKLPVEGGSGDKWVLTRSSKTYMIGDFKKVNDNWYFIPDANVSTDMNFGHDDYAAQTYSDMPDDRRVMVSWMTNFDYSSELADITHPYNGTFTMAYELKLKNTADGIKIYQTPVEEYQSLRKTPFSLKNATIGKDDTNVLANLKATIYEIVAEITPNENAVRSQFGFNLRTGQNQVTKVYYNISSQTVVVDRASSGANPKSGFNRAFSTGVKLHDGKLKLHIFVDESSIEVFVNDGEHVASLLMFPDPESDGMEFYSNDNYPVLCDIEIYPLKTIWREDSTDPWSSIRTPESSNSPLNVNVYTKDGLLNIESNEASPLKMEVFTIDGRLLLSNTISTGSSSIPVKQGIYVMKLTDGKRLFQLKIKN